MKNELQRTSISKQDQDTKELNFDSKRDMIRNKIFLAIFLDSKKKTHVI